MRIVVTGGGGFIGSNLVDKLIDEGHSVTVIDKNPAYGNSRTDKIHMIQGDFGDVNLLKSCLEGVDLLFHLACTTIPKTSNENPVLDVSSNLIGTIRLLESSVHAGIKRIIFNSTGGAIYGAACPDTVYENSMTNPICSYGINKLAVEKYLGLFQHTNNLDYVVFRISNAYGPRQNPQSGVGLIAAALDSVINRRPLYVWGDGSIIRDYIYIDDITQALIMATRSDFPTGIYHASNGVGLSVNQIIEIIEKVAGTRPDVRYTYGRNFDIPKVVLDNTKLRSLGWILKFPIEKGIYETWRWMIR
ncbi:MAG: NAD-dependent epimerase/dehydratase family protein [Proteobacteria bacterium]|nr:NAD-dependent epimerase/dehydratase family protein [Pseudomonadota bacterium]